MKRTRQLLLLVAAAAALLTAVSLASAEIRLHSRGTWQHGDRAVRITVYFGSEPHLYQVRSAYSVRQLRPTPNLHARPETRHRPSGRAPVCRQGTCSRDPAGYWVGYYGGQAFRHGPYLYVPMRSWDGVRRYRRIWVGH